jgi:hypothetical protein
MNKQAILIAVAICLPMATQTQAKSDDNALAPTITVTKLEVTDKTLEVRYQIKNGSKQAVWFCEDVDVRDEWDFEAYVAEDNQTLMIRKRLDVWANLESYAQRIGKYIRLPAGQDRSASLRLALPVHPQNVYLAGRVPKGLEYATRVAVEVGYYAGDLPSMIQDILEKAEKSTDEAPDSNLAMIKRYLGDRQYFNGLNKNLDPNEEVLVPYSWQALKGEHSLRATRDGLHIPYDEKWPKPPRPDLSRCTRVEIQYQPSLLGYFFPHVSQQNLLNAAEKERLASLKTVVVEDKEHLKALAREIGSLSYCGTKGGTISAPRMAQVMCHREGEPPMSLTIYNNEYGSTFVRTEAMHHFRTVGGLESLEIVTSQIQPFESRVQCADKLQTLQIRLSYLYKNRKQYPGSRRWCDTTVRILRVDRTEEYIADLFTCPNAGKGKCHYAMNANCRYDSPPDMVLFFETKAGWNQHGGPELFAFDNHDPKGGCVLFNDGTVKFIRTKEELQQLRWK